MGTPILRLSLLNSFLALLYRHILQRFPLKWTRFEFVWIQSLVLVDSNIMTWMTNKTKKKLKTSQVLKRCVRLMAQKVIWLSLFVGWSFSPWNTGSDRSVKGKNFNFPPSITEVSRQTKQCVPTLYATATLLYCTRLRLLRIDYRFGLE